MKSFKLLASVLLVTAAFSSCNKDENTSPATVAPVIAFSNGVKDVSVNPGDEYTIKGTITSVEGLAEVKFLKVATTGDSLLGSTITSFINPKSYSFEKMINNIRARTEIKVMATDKKNKLSVLNFTLNANGTAVITYANISLGSYNCSTGSSFSAKDGIVYQLVDAKANSSKIDIIYAWVDFHEAFLSAPQNTQDLNLLFTTSYAPGTWTTKNFTKLQKLPFTTNFDAINTSLDIPDVGTNGTNEVTDLVKNDIIAFKTASTNTDFPNKRGVLKVVSVVGTDYMSVITFNVKVAK